MMAHNLSQKQFTAKDVYRILGVDKNRLFHWINTHRLLEPDIDEGGGRGNRRRFSRNNLLELAIIRELHHYGIDLRMIGLLKKQLDVQRIEAKYEDGTWVHVSEKDVPNTQKLSLYDWAFVAETETRTRLFYEGAEGKIIHYTLIGKQYEQEDTDRVKGISSYLTINVTKLASSIMELAAPIRSVTIS